MSALCFYIEFVSVGVFLLLGQSFQLDENSVLFFSVENKDKTIYNINFPLKEDLTCMGCQGSAHFLNNARKFGVKRSKVELGLFFYVRKQGSKLFCLKVRCCLRANNKFPKMYVSVQRLIIESNIYLTIKINYTCIYSENTQQSIF